MDEKLNKEDSSSIQALSPVDTMTALARGMQSSITQIEELNSTIDVQREIISEQACKIQELNEVLAQRLHSSFKR
jgi:hypothetical protein